MKKYYKCSICGNLLEVVEDGGNKPVCCSRTMDLLIPGDSDGAKEKHVPSCKVDGCKVKVCIGSEPHPMEDEHYIEWISLETDKGYYRKYLVDKIGDEATCCFKLKDNEKPLAVYAYCNLHGLWMCDLNK